MIVVFKKPQKTAFKRNKLSSRKKRDYEPFEKIWGALTGLPSIKNMKVADEANWTRKLFICNKKQWNSTKITVRNPQYNGSNIKSLEFLVFWGKW